MKQLIHIMTLLCGILPLVMCSSPQADKSDFSTVMCAADSTYRRWKEVPLAEGSNPKDYFIVDYLRERGRYSEAPGIRHLCRSAGDKRHSAGLSGSLRCSRTRGTLRNTEERSPAASAQTVDYCLVLQIAAAAGTSRMDVMAVSESRGMRNTVTFNRIFRQTYGITPTEYLKSKS